MMMLSEVVLLLQFVVVFLLVTIIVILWRNMYVLDIERVIEKFAADLLKDWNEDVVVLDEAKTKQYVLNQYLQLCANYGLPETAAPTVAIGVWRFVDIQQKQLKDFPTEPGFTFYE